MFRSLDVILRDPANYADNDERQVQDDSITLVREYIARLFREETGAISKRRFSKTGIALIGRSEQLEIVVSKPVFRRDICVGKSPKLVLEHLRIAGLLNLDDDGQIWVWRKFPKPLGRARVASIKPTIQRWTERLRRERRTATAAWIADRQEYPFRPEGVRQPAGTATKGDHHVATACADDR